MKELIKYWDKFKTKAEFISIQGKRICWGTCEVCKKKWNQIETNHIHMKTYQDPKKFRQGNGTFFICDKCYKNRNDES